jgi:hypothetical protein
MTNVVRLHTRPRAKANTSPAFEAAWAAFPRTGQLRSSRKMAWPEWCSVCETLSEEDLAARVLRYAKEDVEHKRECGAPGFHRWLKWGRWEHWAPVASVAVVQAVFPDAAVRASFHERFPDERPQRWLDRCGWDADAREIINAPPARSEWLAGPFTRWARVNDVRGVVFGNPS